MGKKKRISTILLFAVVVLSTALFGLSCKKDESAKNGVSVDASYYCDFGGDEYGVSLTKDNNYILYLAGDYKYGTYALSENGELKLSVDGNEIDAVISGDELSVTYGGKSYTLLEKIERRVTFDDNGNLITETVLNGRAVTKPDDPQEKAGEKFVGWYTSADFTEVYNFATPVRGDITVYGERVKLKGIDEFVATLKDGTDEKIETANGVVYGLKTLADKDGKAFDGWYVSYFNDENKLGYVYNGETLKENVNLYPVWKNEIYGVTVKDSRLVWQGEGSAFDLKITGPNGSVSNPHVTQNYLDYEFKVGGEYKIEIKKTGSSEITTVYYNNNALARVSNFEVINGGMLVYNAVENAEKYYVTVECGNRSHNHTDVDNGKRAYFDISGCDMKDGGIKIIVVAEANGFVSSQSEAFYYDKTLDKVTVAEVKDGKLTWGAVKNALGYVVKVNGDEFTVNGATEFSLKNYPAGEYKLEVYPVTKGYNSPESAKLTYNKANLATPAGVAVNGNILTWGEVDGAVGYVVKINGKEETVTAASRELSIADFGSAKSIAVSVKAIGENGSSEFSDDLTVGCTSIDKLAYANGRLEWSPVLGAEGYVVTINGGEGILVDAGVTYADIAFDKAGENTVMVEYRSGNVNLGVKTITVTTYAVSFYTANGELSCVYYIAAGDYLRLPVAESEGYEFGGWYEIPDGGNNNAAKITDGIYTRSGNSRYYAYFTSAEYVVNLDPTDGTLTTSVATVKYMEKYTLPVPVSDSTNKIFGGWYSEPFGAGLRYTDGDGKSLSQWIIANDGVTLYAYWSAVLDYKLDSSGESYRAVEGEGIAYATRIRVDAKVNGLPVRYIDSLSGAKRLVSIEIPDTANIAQGIKTGIESSVFADCSLLEAINVYQTGDEAEITSYDGVLYAYEKVDDKVIGTKLMLAPPAKRGTVSVMDGTTEIAGYAFKGVAVTDIVIPVTVNKVGEKAFENCTSLTSVEFSVVGEQDDSEEVTIESNAFAGCSKLKTVKLPGRLKKGEYEEQDDIGKIYGLTTKTTFNGTIFSGCKEIEDIEIVGKEVNYKSINGIVYSVDGQELLYCPKGKTGEIKINNGTKKVANNAFNLCEKITDVELPFTVEEIGEFAFSRCVSLSNVKFGGGSEDEPLTIRTWAFANCTKIAAISLPENLYRVESDAFHNSSNLREVTLTSVGVDNGDGVRTLDFANVAFGTTSSGNSKVMSFFTEKLTIGKNVPEFAISNVFGSSLKYVVIDADNKSFTQQDGIVYSADVKRMLYCPSSAKGVITIPDTVEIIGDYLFRSANIDGVVIPSSVKSIGVGAFYNCANLKTVTIIDGDVPLKIDNLAFYRIGITEVTLPKRLETLGMSAFENCGALERVTFTQGIALKAIPETAFKGCEVLQSINIAEGITSIGDNAFMKCKALETVELPSTLTELGDGVFNECTNISSLGVRDGNVNFTTIDGVLYVNNKNGAPDQLMFCPTNNGGDENFTVNVPATVTNVAGKVFSGNKRIKKIVFADHSDKDLSIGMQAFEKANALEEVILPHGIKTIGQMTFAYSYIKSITIPNTVEEIQPEAFYNAAYLSSVTFEQGGKGELVIADAAAGTLCSSSYSPFTSCYSLKEIELPERTTKIGIHSFGSTNFEKIVLPSTITSIGRYAFSGSALKEIDLSKTSITEIPDRAFRNCKSLKEVKLPETLTSIGYGAFMGSGLTSITIPASVTTIDGQGYQVSVFKPTIEKGTYGSAFMDCEKLTSVTFADGSALKAIGNRTFKNCKSLATVNIPETAATIGDEAFYKTALTDVAIPAVTTKIGKEAFRYSDKLTSVSLVEGALSSIGDYAFANTGLVEFAFPETSADSISVGADIFRGSRYLEKLHLSSKVTDIDGAFDGSVSLKEVTVADENMNFSATAGVPILYNKDKTAIRYIFGVLNDNTAVIDKNTTQISANAYAGQTEITTVVIPKGILSIGSGAFRNCTNLTTVVFEDGCEKLTELPDEIFAGCTSLKDVILPVNATKIGKNAFSGCTSLETVNINKVNTINESAFAGSGLKTYEVPSDVKTIGKNAFKDSALKEISLGSVQVIGDGAFEGTEITSVTIPESVTKLGVAAFRNCVELKNVKFRTSALAAVGDYAFYGCIALKSIVIPEGVTRLGGYAFANCENLADIELPSTLEMIASECDLDDETAANVGHTFENCTALKSIDLPDRLSYLGSFTFNGSGLVSIELPDAVVNLTARNEDFTVYADESEQYDNYFRYNEDGPAYEDEVDAYKDTYERVMNYAAGQFANCQYLETVILSANLRNIGSRVFWRSPNLKKIVYRGYLGSADNALPSTVRVITTSAFAAAGTGSLYVGGAVQLDWDVFADCGFSSITFGNECSFEKIPLQAFYNAKNLTMVTLPDSVTQIGGDAFWKATSLKSVVNSENVETVAAGAFAESGIVAIDLSGVYEFVIDEATDTAYYEFDEGYTFYECKNLVSVTLGDNLEILPDSAFFGCTSLKNIVIPDSVTAIENKCFYNSGLEYVYISENVEDIGTGALAARNLKDLIVDENNSEYECNNGFLVDSRGVLIACAAVASELELPAEVKSIDKYAFANVNGVKGLTLSANLTDIPAYTFADFTGLESVVIPNGVKKIGNYAFRGCTSLESVQFADTMTEVGTSAFEGCVSLKTIIWAADNSGLSIKTSAFKNSGLETVEIPSDLKGLGNLAFLGCELLTSVTLPENIAKTPTQGFRDCVSLKSIVIPASVTTISDYTFDGCTSLSSVVIEGYVKVGGYAFGNCSSLETFDFSRATDISGLGAFKGSAIKEAVLPAAVTTVKGNLFTDCEKLEKVVINDGATKIDGSAFKNCVSLKSIEIPSSVTSIGTNAFAGSGLERVTLKSEKCTFGTLVFAGCESLATVELQEGDITLGEEMFKNCTALKTINIPSGITSISKNAFIGSGLESISLTNGVYTVGEGAFTDCASLKLVNLDGVGEISDRAFENCTALTTLVIPSSVTEIDGTPFVGWAEYQQIEFSLNSYQVMKMFGNGWFGGCSASVSYAK